MIFTKNGLPLEIDISVLFNSEAEECGAKTGKYMLIKCSLLANKNARRPIFV